MVHLVRLPFVLVFTLLHFRSIHMRILSFALPYTMVMHIACFGCSPEKNRYRFHADHRCPLHIYCRDQETAHSAAFQLTRLHNIHREQGGLHADGIMYSLDEMLSTMHPRIVTYVIVRPLGTPLLVTWLEQPACCKD